MPLLLQISDTHFGTEQPPVVDALVALAVQQQPELVVLSGDVTQRARPAQFQAAKAALDRLGLPVLAIPGNHDIPLYDLFTRLVRPYAHFRAVFGDVLEPVHASPDFLVIGVKTTRRWRHKDGEVSTEQIDRVAARLQQAVPEQLRIVVVHQPMAVQQAKDAHDRLHNCDRALEAWAKAGCDLVLGGHIHLPYVIELPGLARPIWAVQAGTALSSRVRGGIPNSVNLLRWGASAHRKNHCMIERWDYSGNAKAFARISSTDVNPGASSR
ncbi:MAG: metallophosphoesterase family protein [Burkholderiales bacterium]